MSARVEPREIRDPWQTPATVATGGASDIATAMLEVMVHARGTQQETARANVEHARALIERAREEMQKAMKRAEEAEACGSFWSDVSTVLGSDVASIAGVVAAVALAVATGGAGAPAVLALVAAGLTVGAKAGQELGADPKLTAALGIAGGALGLFAGNLGSAGSAWATVAQIGGAVQGGASGAGGGASIVEGQYRAEALDERAAVKAAESRQDDAWLRFDLAIELLDGACRDISRAKDGASSIERTESDGANSIIARIGAA